MTKIKYLKLQYNIDFSALLCYTIYSYIVQGGCLFMTYSYNKLWKILIDRRITKTEMRKLAGISTNMFAKMGRYEPVSMETLAKISTALECGLGYIVDVSVKEI